MIEFIKQIITYCALPFIERKELKPGVSALVCCKDEEYNIELCLNSLVGLVDQIICIDHNSSDRTFNKMMDFKNRNPNINVCVKKFDGTSLKDARNYGLKNVVHKWLLNCGGDFVFDSENLQVRNLFQNLQISNKFQSYQLTYVNLYGDLYHTYKNSNVIATGEYYIVKLSKPVKFVENQKFDYLKIPFFYNKKTIETPFFFHLSGMKDDLRLLYRNCYFEWREIVNHLVSKNITNSPYLDFTYFEKYWRLALYETSDEKSIKYRHSRQICEITIKRYDPLLYVRYPKIINELISRGNERFKVAYKNDKPYYRKDSTDVNMLNYEPTEKDLNWSILGFKEKIIAKKYLIDIKNEYK